MTKIADLNVLWPLATDERSLGDDHLRNIKTALASLLLPASREIAGRIISVQWFVTSGTWTKPSGITGALIMCLGGGGGGGGGSALGGGMGGGAGALAFKLLDVTGLASAAVTVGSGGAGGATGIAGSSGTQTSFSTYCVAHGGVGGYEGGVTGIAPGGEWSNDYGYGLTSTGDFGFPGGAGESGWFDSPYVGGKGGGATGGCPQKSAGDGYAGVFGGGGAGGSGAFSGGNGGTGACLVIEFT